MDIPFKIVYNHSFGCYKIEMEESNAGVLSLGFETEKEALLYGALILNAKTDEPNTLMWLFMFVLRMCKAEKDWIA